MAKRPGFVLVASGAAFIVAPAIIVARDSQNAPYAWIAAIVSGAITLTAVARVMETGLLVDERGRWSLARGQLIAWNVLLLSTFWTIFVCKLLAGAANPLAVGFDTNIAGLLGISGASFVASPLILARKQATPGLVATTNAGGIRDLFRGEDAGNADVVDLGRVQMVFFTVVTLVAYFAACLCAFSTLAASALQFPPVTSDMLTLLAISHATYLVNKNTDRPSHPRATGSTDA